KARGGARARQEKARQTRGREGARLEARQGARLEGARPLSHGQLMRLPFGRSLRFRVVLVILATTLAALLVSTAALVLYEARSYRDAAVTDATTQADIIARSSAPALV